MVEYSPKIMASEEKATTTITKGVHMLKSQRNREGC